MGKSNDGGDDVAPTLLNEGQPLLFFVLFFVCCFSICLRYVDSFWLGGNQLGKVLTWWDLKKIQHRTWFMTKQKTYLVT
jgi:hypothetical protein